mmetsp:Transcript_79429/g.199597  ORF Transcript_79429/g.199597 Transcript_79429/m.199597 type:complete len:429 (+) Transcript_79429:105-1391(+)
MAKIAAALAAFAVGASARTWKDGIPSFEEHLKENGLSYSGSELQQREALFDEAVKQVKAQNSNVGATWKATINQFATMTPEEKQGMFGYLKQTGKQTLASFSPMVHAATPPEHFDWRTARPNVVTAVKNQGGCGSCWAFASTAVMESVIAIDTGVLFDLSPQQVTSCTPNPDECGGSGGCSGATAQLAFNYTIKAGITSMWTYPYTSYMGDSGSCAAMTGRKAPVAGITGYVQLPQNDATALMAAVLTSPVSVSVAASDWHYYSDGIFDGCNKEHPIINHAVVLMGYGVEGFVNYWTIRNSWGPTWGEKGYIRLMRYPDEEPCGVDNEPLDGYSCKSNPPGHIVACGMCGVLADSAYPTGGFLGLPQEPSDPALNNTTAPRSPTMSEWSRPEGISQVQQHDHLAAQEAGLPEHADGAAFVQLPLRREL